MQSITVMSVNIIAKCSMCANKVYNGKIFFSLSLQPILNIKSAFTILIAIHLNDWFTLLLQFQRILYYLHLNGNHQLFANFFPIRKTRNQALFMNSIAYTPFLNEHE